MLNPKYKLTNKIVSALTDIAEARAIIQRAKILPARELKLRRQALTRMTHSSTAIEGNILNIGQVEKLIQGKKVDAPARDIYEVKNYLKAIKLIEKVVKEKKDINQKIILKIHALVTNKTLPKEQSGKYRKGPVYIIARRLGFPDQIIYTAPKAEKVSSLVKDLISWLEKSKKENINPIITAGIAHRELAAIHPFNDGNGRTARALATLVLYERGFDFRKLFASEDYYNKDRPSYYSAINIGTIYKKVNFTKWLEYFVHGFLEEIESVKQKVISFSNIKVSEKQVYLNTKQAQIIDSLNTMEQMTVNDVMDILSCPKRTAQLELKKLKDMNMIKQIGKARAVKYVLKK